MIDITRLYCGTAMVGEALYYGRRSADLPEHLQPYAEDRKLMVVWSCTRRGNPTAEGVEAGPSTSELSTEEGRSFVQDLAEFGARELVFVGGEPLLREDVFDLARLAASLGMRPALRTDGTLISKGVARDLKKYGFARVEIGLEGIAEDHDQARGVKGAFDGAMAGLRYSLAADQKAGLRYALGRQGLEDLPLALDLVGEENVPAVCFAHPVYPPGSKAREEAPGNEAIRRAVDAIIDRSADFARRGLAREVFTADNDADGVHLYLRMVSERSERADEVRQLLRWRGGNDAGVTLGAVDDEGNVHPDPFWQHRRLGNVRERTFSQIWSDRSEPLLSALRQRGPLLKGRCGACRHQNLCVGSSRVRAETVHGDPWAEEPACYLTDEEIGA